MNLTTTYTLTDIYVLDFEKEEVIHTKTIKRTFAKTSGEVTDTSTQVLKSTLKQYDMLNLPNSLKETLKKGSLVSYEAVIDQKQFDKFMLKDTDLFEISVEGLQFKCVLL